MHSLSSPECPVQACTSTAVALTWVVMDGTVLTSSAIVSSVAFYRVARAFFHYINRYFFAFIFFCTAVEVRRELVSRNLEGDHKIIKFIENCIKSVDGWRFKKSGNPSLQPAYVLSSNLVPMPSIKAEVAPLSEDLMPYPMRFASLKDTLQKKATSSSVDSSSSSSSASASSAAQQKETGAQSTVGLQRPEMFEEAQFIGYSE